MGRFTVRLPDTLHDQLIKHAEKEGVSLNQYVVFCLTRTTMVDDIKRQEEEFNKLLTQYPSEEAEKSLQSLLKQRKTDPNLNVELSNKITSKIAKKKQKG